MISFEDLADAVEPINAVRLALFLSVEEMPGSVTEISERLHRDRSAVKRDVDQRERAGMVTVSGKVLPGHGRMTEVRATAKQAGLMAVVA